MRPRLLAATFAALSLFFAAGAFAQEGGQDEVSLKNGGAIRGTVVSSEPGTSVKIIEMGQKAVRVIPWAQVSDVERGKYAPKGAAQPGPAGPGYGMAPPRALPAPEPQMGQPGVVRLHVDSPVPTQVVEHAGTTVGMAAGYGVVFTQLRPVCVAPCDRVIDGSRGQGFAITGPFPTPGMFNFANMTGDVTLFVKPGSIGGRWGGLMLTILGGSTLLTGAILLPLALERSTSMRNAGIGMLAGGGVALVGGIVLLATTGTKIRFEQQAGGPVARAGQAKPRYWLGEF